MKKLIKVLPTEKKRLSQLYEVFYEENFKEKNCLMKEKEIIRQFAIDKNEFKLILRNSLADEKC